MLKKSSNKTREKFLKNFTKELLEVKNAELTGVQKQMQERARIRKEVEVEKLRQKYVKPMPVTPPAQPAPDTTGAPMAKPIPSFPRPTKPVVPKRMQGMQPSIMPRQPRPMPTAQPAPMAPMPALNLGKIDALIRDPSVTSIECEKANKRLTIKKNGQVMTSEIKLLKDEITQVINEFSEKARIPLIEGLLRARIGNLQISAVVSKVTSSRFIITKTAAQALPSLGRPQPAPGQMMPPIKRPFVGAPRR